MKNEDKLNTTARPFVKVYYQINPNKEKPYRVYERESLAGGWRMVGDYKTPQEAKESGLSRAVQVAEIGAVIAPVEKGFFSWFDAPSTDKSIPCIYAKANRPG